MRSTNLLIRKEEPHLDRSHLCFFLNPTKTFSASIVDEIFIRDNDFSSAVFFVNLPVQLSRASLTVRITVKNGNPPETGKIWENRFFTGKMDHHGAKCTQIGAQTCQGTSRTCQNFFTFTFKAAGVTFLKVILHLLQKVLNRR